MHSGATGHSCIIACEGQWTCLDNDGLISGLPIAARYEVLNANRPGIARSYWDAFGVGMMLAVTLIILGSLWSVYSGIRASRMKAAEE